MDTVSNGEFTIHDVRGGRNECDIYDILVHTDPDRDKPVIITADDSNNELRTYDLTSWQCVSRCRTPSTPRCLYESDGDVYLHWEDGSVHIVSLRPLTISTSPHARVTGVEGYEFISHLGPGRHVAVSDSNSIHMIDLHGRQLADLTTCGGYRFTWPQGVVCAGRRIVVTGTGKGNCLGREWDNGERVVCVEESVGSWSVQWMHDVVDGDPRNIVVVPGGDTVIVPCGGSPGRIVSLSLETGAVIQQVGVAPFCPKLGWGTCIYGGRLIAGCSNAGVVEFSFLQGMLLSTAGVV
jgi:hypothetical protein